MTNRRFYKGDGRVRMRKPKGVWPRPQCEICKCTNFKFHPKLCPNFQKYKED